jgi:hypothetical protein
MLKKFSIISILLISFSVLFVSAEQPSLVSASKGPVCVLQGNVTTALPDDSLGRGCAWVLLSLNTTARNVVVGLLTYCVAYTLYQTAKGIGSTAWTWWKGEKLSPSLQRHVDAYVAELIRKNGMGQMAIYRNPHHHEDGICTCADCLSSIRTR